MSAHWSRQQCTQNGTVFRRQYIPLALRHGVLLAAYVVVQIAIQSACPTWIATPEVDAGISNQIDAGQDEDKGPDLSPPADAPPFAPSAPQMRRLLAWQYENALRDLLGSAAADRARSTLPQDVAVNGFDAVGSTQLSVSLVAVEAYEQAAFSAIETALSNPDGRARILTCTPNGVDDAACYRTILQTFTTRAFRRPPSESDLAIWLSIAQEAARAYNSFEQGLAFALAGVLQSPRFLYLVEYGDTANSVGNVPAGESASEKVPLDGYEMAARLSFFLNGTLPDEQLLQAAENGLLSSKDGVVQEATRLLEKPQARFAFRQFFDEVFKLRQLPDLVKDAETHPEFTASLRASMREETLAFAEHIAFDVDTDFRDLFDANYTLIDANLAKHYQVSLAGAVDPSNPDAAQAGQAAGFFKIMLPNDALRGGILGQAGFLSSFAHVKSTSPTLRGKFVREMLLCQSVPAPPPEVSTVLPEDEPNAPPTTLREKLLKHQEDPNCAACHSMMDDIGFGLENFDEVGRYRQFDNGLPINADSFLDDKGSFAGPRQLGQVLRQQPEAIRCLVRNFYRFGVGHIEEEAEKTALYSVDVEFAQSGFRAKALLLAIVSSDAFRYVRSIPVAPANAAADGE